MKHPSVKEQINFKSLNKYLTFEYVPAPNTIFENIKKLLPGNFIDYSLDKKEISINKYWDIPISEEAVSYMTTEEYCDELLNRLTESIKYRMISDVPIGIFLSGGIDSSLVTAIASQLTNKLMTFTIGFSEASFDETRYANEISELFGTDHHVEILDLNKAYTMLPEIINYIDEPLADASFLPTYLLSQFTSKYVKVALGGDGGDELFAGYPTYQALKLINYYNVLPTEVRSLIHKLANILPVSHKNMSFDFKIKQLLKGVGLSHEIMFFIWMGSFTEKDKKQLLKPHIRKGLRPENTFEDIFYYIKESNLYEPLNRALYLSMKLYLQDDILVKVDRASMANSIEVRAPFLVL